MTSKEQINKNIGLSFDFVRFLIANPKEAVNLPDDIELEFVEKDFDSVSEPHAEKKKYVKVKNTFEVL